MRARFLLASVISVSAGLAAAWHSGAGIDAAGAALTMAGVLALHASVDLLNDYWDHRRGIDARTVRTPFSGGTGVIGEGLLGAGQVRRAGIAMLGAGALAGAYLAAVHGPVIAAMLGFAVAAVYLYSTKIVDSGLAELLVGIKGALIVMGAAFVQSGEISATAAAAGIAVGSLSSTVLFAASFPDREADRAGGRTTLVIAAGARAASRIFAAFPAFFCAAVAASVALGALPAACLASIAASPLAARAARSLMRHHSASAEQLVPAISDAVLFARMAGALVVAGLLASAAA